MVNEQARVGKRLVLVHADDKYPSPIGTTYQVRAVNEAGLMCRKEDDGKPTFIPTNCMFPIVEQANGFTINHHAEARAIAVYEWLD